MDADEGEGFVLIASDSLKLGSIKRFYPLSQAIVWVLKSHETVKTTSGFTLMLRGMPKLWKSSQIDLFGQEACNVCTPWLWMSSNALRHWAEWQSPHTLDLFSIYTLCSIQVTMPFCLYVLSVSLIKHTNKSKFKLPMVIIVDKSKQELEEASHYHS